MTDIEYFKLALSRFHVGGWFTWKTHDDDGNKIPNADRMTYANIVVTKEGVSKPSEADVNAKIQEIKDAETDKKNLKASAKAKLIAGQPLTEEEADTIVL
tara:strand:+ start:489 stop:788 length:300 start_codon:yes stop_codon:yes gene_type:complete